MNTGVGDAIDLAWKLAATLDGWGGPALLASYDAERRPVAKRNAEEATRNLKRLSSTKGAVMNAICSDSDEGARQRAAYRQALNDADILRHHDTDGIALGYRYDASRIIMPDGTSAPPDSAKDYVPTARPGHRAPHAWLDGPPPSAGMRLPNGRSTLDLFGNGFVLLDFGAPADADRFALAARECRMPLAIERLAQPAIVDLYEHRLVLVRPDGHVAWRGDHAPGDPRTIIDRVRGAAGTLNAA